MIENTSSGFGLRECRKQQKINVPKPQERNIAQSSKSMFLLDKDEHI